MKIRKVATDDLNQLKELNHQAIPHVNDIGLEELEYFAKNAELFLVVDREDSIAGFMILLGPGLDYESLNYKFFDGNYSDFLYVDRIVVKSTMHRYGIGKALYNEMFCSYPDKKITCEVNVIPDNPESLAFHKAMGFKEIAQQVTEKGSKRVSLQVRN